MQLYKHIVCLQNAAMLFWWVLYWESLTPTLAWASKTYGSPWSVRVAVRSSSIEAQKRGVILGGLIRSRHMSATNMQTYARRTGDARWAHGAESKYTGAHQRAHQDDVAHWLYPATDVPGKLLLGLAIDMQWAVTRSAFSFGATTVTPEPTRVLA